MGMKVAKSKAGDPNATWGRDCNRKYTYAADLLEKEVRQLRFADRHLDVWEWWFYVLTCRNPYMSGLSREKHATQLVGDARQLKYIERMQMGGYLRVTQREPPDVSHPT